MTQTYNIPQEATDIPFEAASMQAEALATLLTQAGGMVAKSEPHTLQWLALREQEAQRKVRIVDFFFDQTGRDLHFQGQVAAALQEASAQLVSGGWQAGVLAQVQHSKVLASHLRSNAKNSRLASLIELRAVPGQEEALATLLSAAAGMVEKNEEGTLLWYALRRNQYDFVIFDAFADAAARQAHFEGKVAATLKAKSSTLVEGGWNEGVIEKLTHFDVLSTNL